MAIFSTEMATFCRIDVRVSVLPISRNQYKKTESLKQIIKEIHLSNCNIFILRFFFFFYLYFFFSFSFFMVKKCNYFLEYLFIATFTVQVYGDRNLWILFFYFCLITDKILATLGEGTFGKVVKVRDVIKTR